MRFLRRTVATQSGLWPDALAHPSDYGGAPCLRREFLSQQRDEEEQPGQAEYTVTAAGCAGNGRCRCLRHQRLNAVQCCRYLARVGAARETAT